MQCYTIHDHKQLQCGLHGVQPVSSNNQILTELSAVPDTASSLQHEKDGQ